MQYELLCTFVMLVEPKTREYKQTGNGHFLAYIPWVNLAQPSTGGGGARHPPFTLSTISNKVVVYAPAKRAGILLLFLLYPFLLCGWILWLVACGLYGMNLPRAGLELTL